MRRSASLCVVILLCAVVLAGAIPALAQVNTATLSGSVTDAQGLAVRGAKVTATSAATGAERSTIADENGHYTLVGLVPGEYKLRVEGTASFAPSEIPSVQVLVGSDTTVNVRLELGTQTQTVNVTTESAPIETTRSESAQTVDQRQIDNLPINGRNYINFTLTNSQTTRDNSNAIGPAPNSGLNISGSRARSNMVSVDGADFVDNSVEAIRATVSQEAVQEFQIILSNYNAEYGRATGGVVNIVTKSGSNDFHGDLFGYFRNKSFQARNPFSFEVNDSNDLVPVKQAYTRTQSGATFGGALKKDKTFYFFSYEYTQREETGFSSIGSNFDLTTGNIPCLANPATGAPFTVSMTPSQLATYQTTMNGLLALGGSCLAPNQTMLNVLTAASVTAASSNVAVNADMNKNIDGSAVPLTAIIFKGAAAFLPNSQFFPLPATCPTNAQVNSVICFGAPGSTVGTGFVPLPTPSYVGLNSLRGNFPAMEKTSLWSGRLDQHWNKNNTSFVRVGVSPSLVTGIPSTSQNQQLGQNSGSRVGVDQSRDLNATFQHDTILSDTAFNEFRFQFARRGVHFGYSNLPGGSSIGVNIPGYAFLGREPYSTVDRIERRFQFSDSGTITHGNHTVKIGTDYNLIQLRSGKPQIFELDFGGDVNFGGITPFPGLPGLSPLQAYGLGVPQTYIQGIGTSNQPFDNTPIAFFAQDSWRLTHKLTLNYGVRYDLELTPLFKPAGTINTAAEKFLGVIEGIPRDYNNVAPRFGIAWDPSGDGKTVVRAGYGLFYDHPLLAIAFDAVTADGGRSTQLLSFGSANISACNVLPLSPLPPGTPPPTGYCGGGLDGSGNFNGSTIFQGVLNANNLPPGFPSMYYLPNQQRFDPLQTNSLFANQNYLTAGFPLPALPFTLPTDKNFTYAYAQQANLTVERVLAGGWKMSAGYQWTRGLHLYRAVDKNSTDPVLLTTNMQYADAAGLGFTNPLAVTVQDIAPVAGVTCGLTTNPALGLVPGALGVLYGCPVAALNGKFVGTPAFFNFFRPSGPNPSFAAGLGSQAPQCAGQSPFACGYTLQQQLAVAAGFPTGFGVPVPFNSVDAQKSIGNSWYSALTVNVSKNFSKHFELLSSYTWSHSMDDSTDLPSTLEPQDNRFPGQERSNSINDQRHRWVTSGVFQTSPYKSGSSFLQSFLSNFTLAPLFEIASGRPFNVNTGTDYRLDFNSAGVRPSINGPNAASSPYIPGISFGLPTVCLDNSGAQVPPSATTPPLGCTGDLGRNKFNMPKFYQFDLRLSKGISFGERRRLDLIADVFNLFNHSNIIAVNQLCDPSAGSTCYAGQPSAAADARQFQFALKFNW